MATLVIGFAQANKSDKPKVTQRTRIPGCVGCTRRRRLSLLNGEAGDGEACHSQGGLAAKGDA